MEFIDWSFERFHFEAGFLKPRKLVQQIQHFMLFIMAVKGLELRVVFKFIVGRHLSLTHT